MPGLPAWQRAAATSPLWPPACGQVRTLVAVEVGDDEDYHFVLKAYGQSKNVIHIPTELVQVLDTMKEWFRTR